MPATKKKKAKQRIDRYQQTTDNLLALLEKGVKPWVKPWSAQPFQNLITENIYQGQNPLLCSIDCLANDYQQPYYITSKQARDNGWWIKKGSKSTGILYANSYQKEVENDQGEKSLESRFAYRWFPVFNIECIDDSKSDNKISDRIAELTIDLPKNPDDPIAVADEFCNKQEVEVTHGGDRACYVPCLDKIRMPEFESFSSAKKYYATKIHEFIHSTGHKDRLARDLSGSFGSHKYGFEELIAEIGASFVANELNLGFETELEHHASYLQSWIATIAADNKVFFKAVSLARKAADYLLDKGV